MPDQNRVTSSSDTLTSRDESDSWEWEFEPIPTGVEILDQKLRGGIPPGRCVALLASPASQSELFLSELTTLRPTLYLTTVRTREDVLESIEDDDSDHQAVVEHVDTQTSLEYILELVRALPERSNLIIDPMQQLEAQRPDEYRQFLGELRRILKERDSVAFLHCLDGEYVPPNRDTTEYVADIVFELTTERHGENIENHLSVPKFRDGLALEDIVKLDLSTGVEVDFSRTIV